MQDAEFVELLQSSPIMAILRNMPVDRAVRVATRAWDLGIELVEVPVQSPEYLDSLEAVVKLGHERGKSVGAGTVVTAEQLSAVRALGADFAVAPGYDEKMVRIAREEHFAFLPGVATASELQQAQLIGLTWVKVFPAAVLGVEWIRAMRGPFPEMSFVATGGIDASNADSLLAAGAQVVGVGSALEDETQLDLLRGIGAP